MSTHQYDSEKYAERIDLFNDSPHGADIQRFACLSALDEAISGQVVLDYGCGTGSLLTRLSCYFPVGCVIGIEPNDTLRAIAKQRNQLCWVVDMDRIDHLYGIANVVTCTHVLGHVCNPLQTLDDMAKLLDYGGALVISIPNRRYGWAMWFQNLFNGYVGDHSISHQWTARQFRQMVTGAGWQVMEEEVLGARKFGVSESLGFVLRRID